MSEQALNTKKQARTRSHLELPGLIQVKGDNALESTFRPLNRHPGDAGEHEGESDQ